MELDRWCDYSVLFFSSSSKLCNLELLTPCVCTLFPEMSCLMEALQDKQVRLQPECKRRLQDRIDMWGYAAKVSTQTHLTSCPNGDLNNYFITFLKHNYYIQVQPQALKDAPLH